MWPKQPRWMWGTLTVAVLSMALYVGYAWLRPWQPGRLWGLVFGSLAAAVFFLDALYPLRRRLLSWPLGNAQRWLQFHIYGGFLALLWVLIHVGFNWPSGTLGWWLFGLSLWAVLSGFMGVFLQKWLPTVMTDSLLVEAIYDRIPEMTRRLVDEADKVLSGCSDALNQVYLSEIRPLIAAPAPDWSYVFNLRVGRARRLAPLQDVAPFVADEEQPQLEELTTIVTEKLELDAHYSLQRALKYWIYVHVPPAAILLGLLVVHVFAVIMH